MRILNRVKEWWKRPWVIEITPMEGVWIGDSREQLLSEMIKQMYSEGCIRVMDEREEP